MEQNQKNSSTTDSSGKTSISELLNNDSNNFDTKENINPKRKWSANLFKKIKISKDEIKLPIYMVICIVVGLLIGIGICYKLINDNPRFLIDPIIKQEVREHVLSTISVYETKASCTISAFETKVYSTLMKNISEFDNPSTMIDKTIVPSSIGDSIESSLTPTSISESTMIEKPTTTPTAIIYLDENFSKNIRSWKELNYSQDGISVYSKILKNIYYIEITNNNSPDYFYEQIIPIENVEARDFCLSMKIKNENSNINNTAFGLRYRINNSQYYLIYFFTNGTFSMKLIDKGETHSLIDKGTHYYTVHYEDYDFYKICSIDDKASIFINELLITEMQDGTVDHKGGFILSFLVPIENTAKFRIDDLIITDYPN